MYETDAFVYLGCEFTEIVIRKNHILSLYIMDLGNIGKLTGDICCKRKKQKLSIIKLKSMISVLYSKAKNKSKVGL